MLRRGRGMLRRGRLLLRRDGLVGRRAVALLGSAAAVLLLPQDEPLQHRRRDAGERDEVSDARGSTEVAPSSP